MWLRSESVNVLHIYKERDELGLEKAPLVFGVEHDEEWDVPGEGCVSDTPHHPPPPPPPPLFCASETRQGAVTNG